MVSERCFLTGSPEGDLGALGGIGKMWLLTEQKRVHYCAALLPVYSAVFTKRMLTNMCLTVPEC